MQCHSEPQHGGGAVCFLSSAVSEQLLVSIECMYVCVIFPLLPRNVKMDIVSHKMPSENDVHVARSFLTKILRSSMRYGSYMWLHL